MIISSILAFDEFYRGNKDTSIVYGGVGWGSVYLPTQKVSSFTIWCMSQLHTTVKIKTSSQAQTHQCEYVYLKEEVYVFY